MQLTEIGFPNIKNVKSLITNLMAFEDEGFRR